MRRYRRCLTSHYFHDCRMTNRCNNAIDLHWKKRQMWRSHHRDHIIEAYECAFLQTSTYECLKTDEVDFFFIWKFLMINTARTHHTCFSHYYTITALCMDPSIPVYYWETLRIYGEEQLIPCSPCLLLSSIITRGKYFGGALQVNTQTRQVSSVDRLW